MGYDTMMRTVTDTILTELSTYTTVTVAMSSMLRTSLKGVCEPNGNGSWNVLGQYKHYHVVASPSRKTGRNFLAERPAGFSVTEVLSYSISYRDRDCIDDAQWLYYNDCTNFRHSFSSYEWCLYSCWNGTCNKIGHCRHYHLNLSL